MFDAWICLSPLLMFPSWTDSSLMHLRDCPTCLSHFSLELVQPCGHPLHHHRRRHPDMISSSSSLHQHGTDVHPLEVKKKQHQSEPRTEHWRPFFFECLSFKSLHIMAGEGHCKRLCMMQFLRHDSNYCNSTAVSRMATEHVKVGAPRRIAGPWGLTSYHRWHHHKILMNLFHKCPNKYAIMIQNMYLKRQQALAHRGDWTYRLTSSS